MTNSKDIAIRITDEDGKLRSLADIELEILAMAMRYRKGRASTVARELGVGRSTLYRKMRDPAYKRYLYVGVIT